MLKPLRIALATACLLGLVHQLHAQTPTSPDPAAAAPNETFPLEALPEDKAIEVAKQRAELERRKLHGVLATRGVYSSVLAWPARIPQINVCFYGGDATTREKVISIASAWKGVGVPLNFGGDCKGNQPDEHIRVGFKKNGAFWSAVGRNSMSSTTFPPDAPSMNLELHPQLSDDKVRRAILHEFGHALGFEHEHQSPQEPCMPEYDVERLFKYLRDNRGWSRAQFEFQLGQLDKGGVIATEFDKASIMIYAFPAPYYLRGAQSRCYSKEGGALSPGDIKLIRQLFPDTDDGKTKADTERGLKIRSNRPLPLIRHLQPDSDVGKQIDNLLLDLLDALRP
jgi:hypothetical protein